MPPSPPPSKEETAPELAVKAPEKPAAIIPKGLAEEMAAFEFQQRRAKVFSNSTMVPAIFQGPAGVANVLIAMEISNRIGIPLFATLQNVVIIHGKPSWPSSFLVALINLSGKFGPLTYEYKELGKLRTKTGEIDNAACRISTTAKNGQPVFGPWVTMEMAHKDGWVKNDKWQSLPSVMLQWRAVSFFTRAVCPELTLGLPAAEDMDIAPQPGHTTYSTEPDPRRPRIEPTVVTVESKPVPETVPVDEDSEGAQPPIEELMR